MHCAFLEGFFIRYARDKIIDGGSKRGDFWAEAGVIPSMAGGQQSGWVLDSGIGIKVKWLWIEERLTFMSGGWCELEISFHFMGSLKIILFERSFYILFCSFINTALFYTKLKVTLNQSIRVKIISYL